MKKQAVVFSMITALIVLTFASSGYPDDRFVDNGDGTITDTVARLMWAGEDSMGDVSWHEAFAFCKNPPIAGYKYSNWRMPTVAELASLFSKDYPSRESDCGLEVRIHPLIRLSCAWVWASDSKAISAYAFSFRKGYKYSTLRLEKKHFRVLPVRNLE